MTSREAAVAVVDSAGVTIIHGDLTADLPQWEVGSEPLFVTGHDTSGLLLDEVVGAAQLSDGRVVVLNGNPVGAFLLDQGGKLVRSMGRQGGGPGEFRNPQHLFVSGDTILIWDRDFGPGYGFDSLGRVVQEHHVDRERISNALGDSLFSEARIPVPGVGILVATVRTDEHPHTRPEWQQRWGRKGFIAITPTGGAHSFGWYSDVVTAVRGTGTGSQAVVSPMFFSLSHVAMDLPRGLVYLSDARMFRIDARDTTGALRRSLRATGDALRIDDSLFLRGEQVMRAQHRNLDDADYAAGLATLPDVHAFPAILGLVVDAMGHLWVRRSMDDWVVFDIEGGLIAGVTIPLVKVFAIGADNVLGLRTDQDGVESVVLLPLRRR